MPDTSSATDAGAGAEALLGLAAGRHVRLPSLSVIPEPPKPEPSLRSNPQRPAPHSFLPTPPPLQLPEQTPAPIPHLPPPPATSLLPPTTERLPTISEWAEPTFHSLPPPPFHPLPPSDRIADRWTSSSSLPAPYAYAHPQHPQSHWPSHTRSHPFPQPPPAQPHYYYNTAQPQPLPAPYNMPSPPLHTPVTPLPPPLVLPVRRSDSSQQIRPVAPIVEPIAALDRLCDAAVANANVASSSSLPVINTNPSSSVSDPITPAASSNVIPPLIQTPRNEQVIVKPLESKQRSPPSRARGLADLINPTNTPPRPTNNVVPSAVDSVSKTLHHRSKGEMQIESTIPLRTIQQAAPQLAPISAAVGQPPSKSSSKLAKPVVKSAKSEHSSSRIARPDVNSAPTSEKFAENTSHSARNDKKSQTSAALEGSAVARKEDRQQQPSSVEPDAEEDSSDSEETRCPCGSSASAGFMVACDECNTWQHSRCMGFRRRTDVPDKYYCHVCRPEEMRVNCIAHPKYRERSGKDREGRESKRDIEPLLAHVKPVELRRMFVADYRHRKSLLKSGKEHVIIKYSALMKNHFPKHRQGVVDGLAVLVDMSPADVSDRLDSALRRSRQDAGGKQEDAAEKKRSNGDSTQDGSSGDAISRVHIPVRSGAKRQRPASVSNESFEGVAPSRGDSSSHIEAPGEVEMNDYAGSRGMSREDRKLREAMKLFARMEEREKERKRPRIDLNSPRSGHHSRPKTPRSSSNVRIISPRPPGTPRRHTDTDGIKGKSDVERGIFSSDMARQQRWDAGESPGSETIAKEERPKTPEVREKYENGKLSHKSVSLPVKPESEQPREASRRERHKGDRQAVRRKESWDGTNLTGHRRERSILDRNRSHESKRRRIMGKDGHSRSSKDWTKRNVVLDPTLVVPGPSVLGSRNIPREKLSTLQRELCEADDGLEERQREQKSFAIVKKNSAFRKEQDARNAVMTEAPPMRKRYRTLLGEDMEDFISDEPASAQVDSGEPSVDVKHSTLSVSMVVVSEKGSLPDNGEKLESSRLVLSEEDVKVKRMVVKSFCLKKRSVMLKLKPGKEFGKNDERKVESDVDTKLETKIEIKVDAKLETKAESAVDANIKAKVEAEVEKTIDQTEHKDVGKISPVSPNCASQSTSPAPPRNASVVVPSTKQLASPSTSSPVVACSPRLRSSPVSCVRSRVLRSAPMPISKRARSPPRSEKATAPSTVVGDKGIAIPCVKKEVIIDLKSSSPMPNISNSAVTEADRLGSSPSLKERSGAVVGTSTTLMNGNATAGEKLEHKPKLATLATSSGEPTVGGKPNVPGDIPKRICIPLSKPAPLMNGHGGNAQTPVGVRRNLSLGGGLGLRSVPVTPSPQMSKSNPGWNGSGKAVDGVGDGQGAKDFDSGECTVSDILQQRLEGFLKPGVIDVRKKSGELGVRSGAGIEKSRHGTPLGSGNGGGQASALASVSGVIPSVTGLRSKSMDNQSGSWGVLPSFANSKRGSHGWHSGRSMTSGKNGKNVRNGNGGDGRKDDRKNGVNMGGHHRYRGKGYMSSGGGGRGAGGGSAPGGNASASNDNIGRGGGRRRRHD